MNRYSRSEIGVVKRRFVLIGQTKKDIVTGEGLLSRLASSDERAWNEFYRIVVPQLGKFAERRGAADPEDVVQDAMLRFSTALREGRLHLDTIDDARAYLTTLVRNLVVDRFRRDKARCRDVMVPLDEFSVGVSPVAALRVEAEEELTMRVEARRNAVSRWSGSARTKAVYVACVLEGRSVGEVAAELGIPANTVSQMKRRGLKKARALEEIAA